MTVVPIDGRVRVSWLTACASVTAPTVAELTAGTAIEGYITPDGLDIKPATGKRDTSNLGSTFSTGGAGRRSFSIAITAHHNSPTDTAFNLLTYQATGFLAVRRGVAKDTAWTIGQKVEIYPVECCETGEVKPAPDGNWDFDVELVVTSDPSTRATVS